MYGPCEPWTSPEEIRRLGLRMPAQCDAQAAIDYASEVLYALSRHRFSGCCPDTVYPGYGDNRGCGSSGWSGAGPWSGPPSIPYRDGMGNWGNWWVSGVCGGRCHLSTLTLTGPICEVDEIWVNGELLPRSSYIVEGRNTIRRCDGGTWPCTQDFCEPSMTVKYSRGAEVPKGGRVAAAYLAVEVGKGLCEEECALPIEVTSASMEGVSLSYEQTATAWAEGKTGLRVVDLWLDSVNKNRRRASVHRADDLRRNKRVRW